MSEDKEKPAADAQPGAEPSGPQNRYRRRLLAGLAIGGAGLVGGVAGGSAAARTSSVGGTGERLVLDCACLGDTWRMTTFPDGPDEGDLRGSTFYVEGILYPEGHIGDGDGFVPDRNGAVGLWTCRGNFLVHPGRPEPHVMSNQEYILGLIDADNLFPPDMITTVGLEGTDQNFVRTHRAITGGTGNYRGATGECSEYFTGTNSTVFFDDPTANAPNIRFEFDLTLA